MGAQLKQPGYEPVLHKACQYKQMLCCNQEVRFERPCTHVRNCECGHVSLAAVGFRV